MAETTGVIKISETTPGFIDEVAKAGGENVYSCYQCGTCTGGCPTQHAMDYPPRTIIRMIQLGMRDQVLESKTIWTCASCQTCITRCPRGVRIPEIMGALKSIAIKENIKPGFPKGMVFYKEFNEELKRFGLLPEMLLSVMFYIKGSDNPIAMIKTMIKDAPMGLAMFTRGRLTLKPHKIKNPEKMKKIYEASLKMEE